MEYGLTDEQRALDDAVADLLGDHAHPRAAYDDPGAPVVDHALWQRLCGLGVPGLAVPEEHAGAGAGPVELALVCERLGYAVAPVPVLGHVVAAEALRLGRDALAKELLPDLAAGSRRAAFVPAGPGVDPEPAVRATTVDAATSTLEGRVPLVLDAVAADLVVLPAADGDWYVVEAGDRVLINPQPSLDRTRPAAVLVLRDAPARRLDKPGSGARVGRRALALLRALEAAEAVGVAAWALERTREHARTREQFGLPIGTFQAVKHRLADMLVAVENARSASYGAAWALAADQDAATAVAMAQAVATDAAVRVTADAVQLHGGIGVTWENDLHLRVRRAKTLQLLHGSPAWHRAQVAAALLDG